MKAAECRSFFPRLDQRLQMRIPLTPVFTALVYTARENKILPTQIQVSRRPDQGPQTPDHIIYDCDIIEAQRSYLMKQITLSGGTGKE
jgi:hypothetical protein